MRARIVVVFLCGSRCRKRGDRHRAVCAMTDAPITPDEPSRVPVVQHRPATEKREHEQKPGNGGTTGANAALEGDVLPPELGFFPLTEDGVAQAFAVERGNELRYCHGTDRWFRGTARGGSLRSRN